MPLEGVRREKAEQIRLACEALDADEEMTALVLASYRHDPEALDTLVADGGDLPGYVRSKMDRWKAIFKED